MTSFIQKFRVVLMSSTVLACFHGVGMAASPATQPELKAHAGSPGTRPAVYTGHEYFNDILAWNRESIVEAYKKSGKKVNANVDALAVAYLEKVAVYLAADRVDVFYRPANVSTKDALFVLGSQVVAAGCDDPMVAACHGEISIRCGKFDDARQALRSAVRVWDQFGYNTYWAELASVSLSMHEDENQERFGRASSLPTHLVAMCCGVRFAPAQRRLVLAEALRMTHKGDWSEGLLIDLKKYPTADPWIQSMLTGIWESSLAWKARGTGSGAALTPAQVKSFTAHLRQARDALTQAWKLDPSLPEAASMMLEVCMGDGNELNERGEDWFQRALSAQIDYVPAYSNRFQMLLPRWGGSYEEMLHVGLNCIDQPRYDTLVPWQFVRSIAKVGEDGPGTWALVKQPQVYELMAKVMDGYANSPAAITRRDYYGTARAALAWRAHKLGEARQALDDLTRMKGTPDPEAFDYFDAPNPQEAISSIYAFTGADAAAIAEAIEHAADKSIDGAKSGVAALKGIQAKLAANDPARPFVQIRLDEWNARLNFAAGEWISMQPTNTMQDWKLLEGKWEIDPSGTMKGDPIENYHKSLIWDNKKLGFDFGDSFEISLQVYGLPEASPRSHNSAGFIFCSVPSSSIMFVDVDVNHDAVDIEVSEGAKVTHKGLEGASHQGSEMKIVCKNYHCTIFLDGQQVGDAFPLSEKLQDDLQIGLGGTRGTFIGKNPRIRKLIDPRK